MPNTSISERSPNSPACWPAEAFPPLGSLAALVGLVLVYFVANVLLLRGLHVTQQSVRAAQLTPNIVATQLLGYVPVIAYLAIVLPGLARRPLRATFGPFGLREAAAGLGGAVVMWLAVILAGAVQTVFVRHPPNQLAVRLFEGAHPGLLLDVMIVIAIVVAPLAEELVFRGFIFNALWRRMRFGYAAVASGLIFGIAHGEASGILPLAAGGIVLANVYARTGSLWSSVIAHGAFNGITLLLLLGAGIKT